MILLILNKHNLLSIIGCIILGRFESTLHSGFLRKSSFDSCLKSAENLLALNTKNCFRMGFIRISQKIELIIFFVYYHLYQIKMRLPCDNPYSLPLLLVPLRESQVGHQMYC